MSRRLAGKRAGLICRVVVALTLPWSAAMADLPGAADTGKRWYSDQQIEQGRTIYQENCAVCHGEQGEGQPGWQERDSMGFYPAPPLDDSGHAAQHPLKGMLNTLTIGGGPVGGTMPSFSDVLSTAEMKAVLAYVQSLWPEDVYASWQDVDAGKVPTGQAQHDHH